MTEENATSDRTQPDLATLSRFAMTTGSLLLVYVIGGGIIQKEWTSTLIPLKITHPEFLVFFFCGVSLYATWRYWYYAIELPFTRRKKREYLQTKNSILIFSGRDDGSFGVGQGLPITPRQDMYLDELTRKLPPDFDLNEVRFFTSVEPGLSKPNIIKEIVVRGCAKYFPLLDSDQVEVVDPLAQNHPFHVHWAHIVPGKWGTVVRVLAEDADLFAPIWINGIGLTLLAFGWFFCWPSSLCVYGGK